MKKQIGKLEDTIHETKDEKDFAHIATVIPTFKSTASARTSTRGWFQSSKLR